MFAAPGSHTRQRNAASLDPGVLEQLEDRVVEPGAAIIHYITPASFTSPASPHER
jgi:hypothetical protein